MIRLSLKHPSVRSLCSVILDLPLAPTGGARDTTYVFLLLVNMANLKPNVLLGERSRGIVDNVFEALMQFSSMHQLMCCLAQSYLQAFAEFLLLLVNYAQSKVYLVGFLKVRCHVHYL